MGSGPKPGLGPLNISDQIPPWFLKDYATEITLTLTDIVQDSIDSGTVPRRWKGANVCAVF